MVTSLRKTCRTCVCLTMALSVAGCQLNPKLTYLGDADLSYYRAHATEIDYPAVPTRTPDEVAGSLPPHTIRDEERSEIRDMTLMEAIHLALQNSEIIRSSGQFLALGNGLYSNPNGVPSIYDPAIQESGVLFGGRGLEAALAEFDAQLNASMIWSRDSRVQNNAAGMGVPAGSVLNREGGAFQTSLQKIFAHGGVIQLNHNVDYQGTNIPGDLFDSNYSGQLQLQYQQPLLAGAGTEYTRTAGPIANSFGGITGVSQGVLIARINNDITLADFEIAVRNLVYDVETAYWDLYLAYRVYDTAVVARNSALEVWRLAKRQAGEVLIPADEAQARTGYYQALAATQTARSDIYLTETRLRRLLALPINEGAVIRPADEPVSAELVPEWFTCLSEALTNRVELRRQKWNIKSIDLQLQAARSLTRPRLDFIGGYQINGFGDELLAYGSQNAAGTPYNSFYQSITAGQQPGWTLGFQFNLPIGLRQARAQVRNYELRLVKAQDVLAAQELEIGHELAVAFQDLARSFQTMQTNYQRFLASQDDVTGREPRYELGEVLVDEMVRAYERRAQAELSFFQSVVDYNKSLANLQLRKGTLLAYDSVHLLEGPWTSEAQYDLQHHADARAHALRARHLRSAPDDFASDAPVGRVTFTTDAAARMSDPNPAVPDDGPMPAPPAAPPADEVPDPLDDETGALEVPTVLPAEWVAPPTSEPAAASVPQPAAARLGNGMTLPTAAEAASEPPVPAERSTPQSRLRLRRGGLYDAGILNGEVDATSTVE